MGSKEVILTYTGKKTRAGYGRQGMEKLTEGYSRVSMGWEASRFELTSSLMNTGGDAK